MRLSRRQFVHRSAVTTAFLGLSRYLGAQGPGPREIQPYLSEVHGYGPLVPDPANLFDLPEGFSYRILSRAGDRMSDGFTVPALPDGMAAFPGPDGRVILVRNHELPSGHPPHQGPFGYQFELLPSLDRQFIYDTTTSGRPHLGGTTTLVYDPETGTVEQEFLSLTGTLSNCGGGATPWNSWISSEESVEVAGEVNVKHHGYNFEVPATVTPGLVVPVPLRAMGRFYHEAVAIDPRTGIAYQTEDREDGLVYRFLPNTPGTLANGGRLQVLCARDRDTFDTRNFADTGAPPLLIGARMPVRWVDLDNVDTPEDNLRLRGAKLGGALFARGEGIWQGNGELFMACTSGGLSRRGQVFRYTPSPQEGMPGESANPGVLELFLEPNNALLLESIDNLSIAPWRDLILCEDQAVLPSTVTSHRSTNYLRGVTPDGKIYTLACNLYPGDSELAGVCFAPGHPTMFVNIQAAGLTLAVTGPWQDVRRS